MTVMTDDVQLDDDGSIPTSTNVETKDAASFVTYLKGRLNTWVVIEADSLEQLINPNEEGDPSMNALLDESGKFYQEISDELHEVISEQIQEGSNLSLAVAYDDDCYKAKLTKLPIPRVQQLIWPDLSKTDRDNKLEYAGEIALTEPFFKPCFDEPPSKSVANALDRALIYIVAMDKLIEEKKAELG